jgi:hypothetical protein
LPEPSFAHSAESAAIAAVLESACPRQAARRLAPAFTDDALTAALLHHALFRALTQSHNGCPPRITHGAYAWLAMRAEALATALLTADLLAHGLVDRWIALDAAATPRRAESARQAGAFAFATPDGKVTLLRPAHRFAALLGQRSAVLIASLTQAAAAMRAALACASPGLPRLRMTLPSGIVAVVAPGPAGCELPSVHFYADRPAHAIKPKRRPLRTSYAAQALLQILRA